MIFAENFTIKLKMDKDNKKCKTCILASLTNDFVMFTIRLIVLEKYGKY